MIPAAPPIPEDDLDLAARLAAEAESAGQITFETVCTEIEQFTSANAIATGPIYPTALQPIVDKIGLLAANRAISPAQSNSLSRMLLSSGVEGFSARGKGQGVSIVRDMISDACAKIMNERRGERWQSMLMRGERGVPLSNEENAVLAVEHMFGENLRYDEFTDELLLCNKAMSMEDHTNLLTSVQRTAVPSIKPLQVRTAVRHIARKNTYDSLKSYLRGLKWDGTKRLDEWLIFVLGCENTPFNRKISRWFPIGACARALKPGCQMDNMLVLAGPQGLGKTNALRLLSGQRNIEFADDFGTKDGQQQMRGVWFVEHAELSSLSKRDHKAFKAFVSRLEDTYRKAYDPDPITYLRQFINVGTTNDEPFLRDPTGERRYWIAECSAIRKDVLMKQSIVDQIWAEAVAAFDAGEKWWPDAEGDREFLEAQAEVNSRWTQKDGWQSIIEDRLLEMGEDGLPVTKLPGAAWVLEEVVKRDRGQIDQVSTNRVTSIMLRLGYNNQSVWLNGKTVQGYLWKGDPKSKGWWVRELSA